MRAKRLQFLLMMTILALGGLAACSKKGGGSSTEVSQEVGKRYHCPMHPEYTSDQPGDCPICHMRLVEIDANESGQQAVAGQGIVRMPPASEQKIGVTVSPVEVRELFLAIKAPSRVAYDPNLYSAILEYQEARKNLSQGSAENRAESDTTVRASILRLRQMGLSDHQIEEISRPGFDPSNLLLGKAGGKVWVYVDIYDYEAAFVKPGQQVEFTSPALSGQKVQGKVRAVDSIVNSETRTLRVRVEVPNPRGELKPEMYLSATIQAAIGKKLAVPNSAVLDTGVRQLVYVQKAPGQFEPREIRVGREATGYYEVVDGLKAGEQVVTSANFLIDSESKIRAASQGTR
jgi:Cu(I)/Ag(I) efflux system membrane fusion protein